MEKKWLALIALITTLLFHTNLLAKEEILNKTFNISHFPHPALKPYLDKLRIAYKDIGIKVDYIEAPAERGLLLLEKGVLDADFARFAISLEGYSQAQKVDTILGYGHIVLLCHKQLACTKEVLANKRNHIIATNGHKRYAEAHYSVAATIDIHNTATNSLTLLDKGYVDYVIYAVDDAFLENISGKYNSLILGTEPLYHVINIKHRNIAQQLAERLKKHFGEE